MNVTRGLGILIILCGALLLLPNIGVAAVSTGEAQVPFPPPLDSYSMVEGATLWQVLSARVRVEPFNLVATIIFILAITHTFLASRFLTISHHYQDRLKEVLAVRAATEDPSDDEAAPVTWLRFKAETFHFLGEVEAIFGIWVIPLLIAMSLRKGWEVTRDYIGHGVNFTEPLFVVVIMAISASRPILSLAEGLMAIAARAAGGSAAAWWLSILTIGPLLGSFITEPAAMTISALLLARRFYEYKPSPRLAYATLGLLFVNVSVGGTLTHFAAPPVLMVAGKWGWGLAHMMEHFGWKAAFGIAVANAVYMLMFWRELRQLKPAKLPLERQSAPTPRIPFWITSVHVCFLGWTVLNNHFPVLFIGGFLFFLAFTRATEEFQSEISLRGPMLVGFFLAGLVTHGGLQGWWIAPALTGLSETRLFLGAMILTAFNDNAAITYLASLVPGFTPPLQHAVVAGAVVGGGLTVIANAPNPAGQSILSRYFPDGVSALYLLLGALIPTGIMAFVFLVFA